MTPDVQRYAAAAWGERPAESSALPFSSGGWTMALTGHGLEHVTYEGHVVAPRIFFSVRDESWHSPEIPLSYAFRANPAPPDARAATGGQVSVAGRVAGLPLAVSGTVAVLGRSLRVTFELVVEARVDVARAGPCVLHEPPEVGAVISAGPPLSEISVLVPAHISARPIVSGFHRLRLPADGAIVTIEFDGGTYETEDQRNWGDATFKSYCPPVSVERPLRLAPGRRAAFGATLLVEDAAPGAVRRAPVAVGATPGDLAELGACIPVAKPPPIGLTHPGGELDGTALSRIAEVRPAFVHLLVDFEDDDWSVRLRRDLDVAKQLAGCAVLTVDCPRGREAQLARLASACSGVADTVFPFGSEEPITSDRLADAGRRAFEGSGIRVGAGTRGHFASLNVAGRVPDAAEVVEVALAGAAHDDDRRALTTGPASFAAILADARRIAAGRELYLGPVGLAPTFDSWSPPGAALGVRAAWDGAHRRHASRFGAAWAVAAYAALAPLGPARVCLAGTVGGRGVGVLAGGRFHPHPLHAALARLAAMGPGPYAALPPGRRVAGLVGTGGGLVAAMTDEAWTPPRSARGRPVTATSVLGATRGAGPDVVVLSWDDHRASQGGMTWTT